MTVLKKDFFTNNQVLFIGLSSNPKSFSRSVYKEFIKSNITVYPVSSRKFSVDGNDVYSDFSQLPKVPECAYILLNKDNTKKIVKDLEGTGVKKILFHSTKTVDETTLNECEKMGIEAVVACPKMLISKALPHKIHGFLSGIR